MKKILTLKTFVILAAVILIPKSAFAARVYIESNTTKVSAGDIVIVSIKLDSEKATINSIDGNISINSDGSAVVNDFSLAKSFFTLWPQTPSLSPSGTSVAFVGGVPGGFNKNNGTVFNIILETQKEGIIHIAPKDVVLFANDGKGSRVPATAEGLDIQVSPKGLNTKNINEWVNIVSSDKEEPNPFVIALGKDPSILEGKRFAFFNATDDQSGISYYEVSENGTPAIRSGSMYVLQNQDESSTPDLIVSAYDKAGNKRVSHYENPGITIFGFPIAFFVIISLIVVFWFIRRKKINAKKHKNI